MASDDAGATVPADQNTFPVFQNMDISLAMETPSRDVARIYRYWQAIGSDHLPTWKDVDLMEIYNLAPNVMVKEYVADVSDWRNRFYGSGLVQILGIEGTGKLLDDYHLPENAEKARQFFNVIRAKKVPVRVVGQCIVKDSDHKKLEGIYLPLFDGEGEVAMILCYEDYSPR